MEIKLHTLVTAALEISFSSFSYFHANLTFIVGIISVLLNRVDNNIIYGYAYT
jgi:hypothetical protein